MENPTSVGVMCAFDSDTLRCRRCGYIASSLPTFRVCRTVREMAEKIAKDSRSRRIRVPRFAIGSWVAAALSAIGITSERVSAAIGTECGCKRRQDSLNIAGAAVSQFLEHTANQIVNTVLPVSITEDDVAEIANMIVASGAVNHGLVENSAKSRSTE